jgi:hypothetical protein
MALNKTQTWEKVVEILEGTKISKAKMAELEALLAPKTGTREANIINYDGEKYAHCRYTDKYWPCDEMVYQNDEKREKCQSKGYSKVGISLWNKGRQYVKRLDEELKATILAGGDATNIVEQLKELEESRAWNDPKWLEQFITDEQARIIEQLAIDAPKS